MRQPSKTLEPQEEQYVATRDGRRSPVASRAHATPPTRNPAAIGTIQLSAASDESSPSTDRVRTATASSTTAIDAAPITAARSFMTIRGDTSSPLPGNASLTAKVQGMCQETSSRWSVGAAGPELGRTLTRSPAPASRRTPRGRPTTTSRTAAYELRGSWWSNREASLLSARSTLSDRVPASRGPSRPPRDRFPRQAAGTPVD